MAGTTRWHGRSVNQPAKRLRDGLKKERPTTKQNAVQERRHKE